MSLSSIYAKYINDKKEEKERDIKRLFLSDIGSCPRKVAYRMLGAEQEPTSEQEDINKTIMFDLANHIEETLMEALKSEGMLVAFQPEVPIDDRENWGGRADIIADYFGRRVIEVKSVYPGAFKYDLHDRYPQHHHQGNAYDIYLQGAYELTAAALLAYFDRGGQNTPQEMETKSSLDETIALMDELEEVRDNLPELPAKRENVLELRSWGKQIVYEPHPNCRPPYCPYVKKPCKRSLSKSVWAEREKDDNGSWMPWETKKAAKPDILIPFIDDLIGKEMGRC